MTRDTPTIARDVLGALDTGRPIEPITARYPDFSIEQAYAVAAELRALRVARGETAVGRKVGFTNRGIWAQYRIDRPIWGDMYAHTAKQQDPSEILTLGHLLEPQIEPEIVFCLSRAPEAGMEDRDILNCIAWVAHGFEIVQSIYPRWRFEVPDTIAGFGMHGALRFGDPLPVVAQNHDALFAALKTFVVTLSRNGEIIGSGRGSNVLDGPLSAVRHLTEMLASDPHNPALAAGEIVTTGTLTPAYPVKPDETWSTSISGMPIAGISMRFG